MQTFKRQPSLPNNSWHLTDHTSRAPEERVKVFVRVRPAFTREIRQDETALSFRSPKSENFADIMSARLSEDSRAT